MLTSKFLVNWCSAAESILSGSASIKSSTRRNGVSFQVFRSNPVSRSGRVPTESAPVAPEPPSELAGPDGAV